MDQFMNKSHKLIWISLWLLFLVVFNFWVTAQRQREDKEGEMNVHVKDF